LDSSPDFDVVVEVETETEEQSFEGKPMHSKDLSTDEHILAAGFEDLKPLQV
jgi:hypothetical protein